MNSATHNALRTNLSEENRQTGRTARFLRIIGALAIGGSGILYMLQGLYHADSDLRNWVYLALMLALGAGGIFSQRFMQDSKGARLFFALAVLLIPVQFSQLGGMVLHTVSGTVSGLDAFAILAPSSPILMLIGGVTGLAALALSFAGFSILTRSVAKPLSAVFLVMNVLLLLPFRDSFATLPVFAGLIALLIFLERRIFRGAVIFQTLEGVSVRLIVLLPFIIAICRNAFHFSEALGVSAILGASGVVLHYLAGCHTALTANKYTREFLWLMAFVLLLPASLSLTHELIGHSQGLLIQLQKPWFCVVYTLPALACSLYFSARSKLLTLLYQLFASAALCIGVAWALDGGYFPAEFLLWCAAVAALCHGLVRKQKVIFVTGTLVSAGLGGHLIYTIFANIHLNLWLVLAIGGLVLMVLSSVCEKHGRKWLHSSREYWHQFNEWEAR